jgi:hypothetical protein
MLHHCTRKITFVLASLLLLSTLGACGSPALQGRPTQLLPAWPTPQIPTITPTPTPLPPSTLTPTNTLVPSSTPFDTPTPQPTSTALPPFNATPFTFKDASGKRIDTSYASISEHSLRPSGTTLSLSGFVAFELLDRGIYHQTLRLLEKDLTLYSLRVRHRFGTEDKEVWLILTGVWGINIPFNETGADGSANISLAELKASSAFSPTEMHSNWSSSLANRAPTYRTVSLTDLEKLLKNLPQKSLILAENPILFPEDSWHQVKLNMLSVSAQAARFNWLFNINDFNIIVGQNGNADLWADSLLKNSLLPETVADPLYFAADNLVVVKP